MHVQFRHLLSALVVASLAWTSQQTLADDSDSFAPGGTAIDHHADTFSGLKAVMDLKVRTPADVNFGAITVKRILAQPNAKLIVIIEGPAVSMFAKKNYLDHQGTVDSWAEVADAGAQIEYCGNSVHGAGLQPSDMDGLSKRNPAIVDPGAYPSIAHHEQQGYVLIMPSL